MKKSSSFIKKRGKVSKFVVPGWNEYCKEAHSLAKDWYHLWICSNKPRQGYVYNMYRKSKYYFKYSLRMCKKNEQQDKADKIAAELSQKDYNNFWKSINNCNTKNMCNANNIDGITGENNIAGVWKNHFETLLNTCNDKVTFNCKQTISYTDDMIVNVNEVRDCVKSLKCGKAAGIDGISAEHFKYAHEQLNILLAIVFSAMFVHNYLPNNLMTNIIIPVVKDKCGDVTSKGNYRPIAITTVCSKLLEICILHRYETLLHTSDNQFGFKKHHSTDLCIFSVKQIVSYYKSQNSPVFICFLDAAKAFDKVNHCILFRKLLNRGFPPFIVRILCYWYSKQTFCIKWGSTLSELFTVRNGVRQGGILSPLLFNVYIDDLSLALAESKIGCRLNGLAMNNFAYADDMAVLAPSPTGLQKLLDICSSYAIKHDITFNVKKSVCMCVKPKRYKLALPKIVLNGTILEYVTKYKYLGYFMTYDLCDNEDIKRQIISIYCRSSMLIRAFHSCSNEAKQLLYSSFCSNLYCAQLWCNYKCENIHKVKVAFNNGFRKFLNLSRYCSASNMFVSNSLNCFEELRRKSIYNFLRRVSASHNTILITLSDSTMHHSSDHLRKWLSRLYV